MKDKIMQKIINIIFDKKGFNITTIDVREISSLTDFMIIAEGNVDIHVKAIAEAIISQLKKEKILPFKVEGRMHGDWVVIDYQNIIVHLFMPHLRERYQLEKLWSKGEIIKIGKNL